MKHKLSFFVILMMALTIPKEVKAYSFSAISPSGQTLYYSFVGNHVEVVRPGISTNYNISGNLVIPDSVCHNGIMYAVRGLGTFSNDGLHYYGAFYNCDSLISVTIPNSVTYIGRNTFEGCEALVSVVLPNSLLSIGEATFLNCHSLASIVIPDSVSTIERRTFMYCTNLTSVSLPISLTHIRDYAFFDCMNLSSITIPRNVLNINDDAFRECLSLETVIMHPEEAPSLGIRTFDDNASNRSFYIPCNSMLSYQNNWPYTYHSSIYENSPEINLIVLSNDSTMGNTVIIQQNGHDVSCDSSSIIYAISHYGYRFVQWSNGSTSNPDTLFLTNDSIVTAIFTDIVTPQICMVSVQDGHNTIIWGKEHDAIDYNIYRESSVANEFELVAVVSYDSLSVWIDSASRPSTRSYRYRMTATDIFGYESASSTIHKTMHLTINQSGGNHWNLVWSGYSGASYSTYVIYRGTSVSNLQQIDVVPSGGETTYTDNNAPEGDVYYQVGVLMTTSCNPTKTYTVCRSNIATNGSMESVETIDDVENVLIASMSGEVIVNCSSGMSLQVIDMTGRILYRNSNVSGETAIPIPTAGVYMIKVGNYPAKRVVVMN